MKDQLFATMQRVGRAFMLPIAILPVAGLFLGIGGSFTNTTMLSSFNLLGVMGPGTVIYDVLNVMNAAGGIIFGNLPIIFAIAVALAMARQTGTISLALRSMADASKSNNDAAKPESTTSSVNMVRFGVSTKVMAK